MQITIENVEHLTLDLGTKPVNPIFSALMASLASGADKTNSATRTAATPGPDTAAVQTSAQSAKPVLTIGEHYAPAGGKYAGISRGEDGQPDGHIFLLDYKPTTKLGWSDAVTWGESLGDGARLPTKTESALLYANLKDEFEEEWHWTGTQYSDYYAWLQGFSYGNQSYDYESYEGRARAVRRLIL